MSNWIVAHLWLIPAIPLAASLMVLSLSNARRSSAALLAIAGQVIALLLSLGAFWPTLQTPGYRVFQNFTWLNFGDQTPPARLCPRSARGCDAGHDHARQPLHFHFQRRLHGGGQKFHPLLRLSLVLLCRDARGGHRQQPAPSLHLLGTGRARLLSAHRILDSQTERSGGREESLHHDADRRHRVLSRDALALWAERDAALLRRRQRRARRRRAALVRRERHFHRAPHFLRRGGEIGTISAPRLAAGRDGRSDPGERADPCRHHGRGRRVPGGAGLSALFVRRNPRRHDFARPWSSGSESLPRSSPR